MGSGGQMTLDEIAIKHKTDKSTKVHGYTTIYEKYLGKYQDTFCKLLEIGVNRGASIRMWREWLPNSNIYAIDIQNKRTRYPWDNKTRFFQGDQGNPLFLDKVISEVGPFDVVLDDGSHDMIPQITSFTCLWPAVNTGGLYIIEDMNTSYVSKHGGGLRKFGTTIEFLKEKLDDLVKDNEAHMEPVSDIEYMHFYEELVIMKKK
jgi:23S rRNA U2552 (ribose-2'-O)-methylase RlmE/FtsJ